MKSSHVVLAGATALVGPTLMAHAFLMGQQNHPRHSLTTSTPATKSLAVLKMSKRWEKDKDVDQAFVDLMEEISQDDDCRRRRRRPRITTMRGNSIMVMLRVLDASRFVPEPERP
mmetsp:Transcript_30215/g.70630  ORF Transcript_30215/g.70630 Transcript_30215/m.70630 type:complete len:115 (-) Transcript_30215:1106-1450(-)